MAKHAYTVNMRVHQNKVLAKGCWEKWEERWASFLVAFTSAMSSMVDLKIFVLIERLNGLAPSLLRWFFSLASKEVLSLSFFHLKLLPLPSFVFSDAAICFRYDLGDKL